MAFNGFPFSEKLWLTRKLLEEGTKRSMFGRLFVNVANVDDSTVMGCPEGTIVAIVESYYVLREQGATNEASVVAIEDHRSNLIPGNLNGSLALEDYIRYRVRLEHRSGRQISDSDVSRACFMASALAEKFIGEDKHAEPPDQRTERVADFMFISKLPHRDSNSPLGTFKSDEIMLVYYENPKSNGAVVAGIEPPYTYSQVVVVSDQQRPLLMIRSEKGPKGCFLCSLDARGEHRNLGKVVPMGRDEFVKRAGEVLMRIKYQTMDVGETDLKAVALE
jgi:hypothetical protein